MRRILTALILLSAFHAGAQTTIGAGVTLGSGVTINSGSSYPVTIPGDATAYTSLEQTSGWTTDASSDVSPNPPTSYAIVPTGGGGSTMTLETANTADVYAGWMAKIGQTLSATTPLHMLVRANVTFSSSVAGIQAFELGRRLTNSAGITDNGQTQLVPISGNQLELDKVPVGSGWLDTTCRFPMFVLGTTYPIEIYYVNNSAGGLSVVYFSVSGSLCVIPSSMNPVAGSSIGFADSEFVAAFQPDIKPTGASYNAVVTYSAWTW